MILVEIKEGVKFLTLKRPEKKNAIDIVDGTDLRNEILKSYSEDDVICVVLTGYGDFFSSGADLSSPQASGIAPEQSSIEKKIDDFHNIIRSIYENPKPVIAKVNGPAIGFGCEIALICDFKIVSDSAYFSELFSKRGMIPDGGGTFFITRAIGMTKALELFAFGEKLTSYESERLGLVNKVVRKEELDDFFSQFIEKIRKIPKGVFSVIKRLVWSGSFESFDEHLKKVKFLQANQLLKAEFFEGLQAFFQKREPDFASVKIKF